VLTSQAAYGITKKVIFAYDQLEDGVLPEVEVLASMLSYCGPLPPGLLEHVKDSPWSVVLMNLDGSFDTENPATPFSLWTDIDGLEPGDKEFIGRILNLDPALRPSAEELLQDEWFSRPDRILLPGSCLK
jgi:serine/threonine protein kinase